MLFKNIIHVIFEVIQNMLITMCVPIYDFFAKFYTDNPMFKIVLAFVPVILGIAYPLIIQSISRLNDQYKSTHIIHHFKNEQRHIFFLWSLRIAVLFAVLSVIPSFIIFFTAFISVIVLLVSFFLYLDLLLKYHNGDELFKWYSNKVKLIEDPNEKDIDRLRKRILIYWHPIIDLFHYSIRNDDLKLEEDIEINYIFKVFKYFKYYYKNQNEFVEFPPQIHNSINDIILNFLKYDNNEYKHDFEYFIGSIFLVEEIEENFHRKFDIETIYTLWRNIVPVVEYGRMDIIVRFWSQSHQYTNFYLKPNSVEYDDDFKEKESSVIKRKSLEKDKNIFFQFHTVLGAYLLYKHEYSAIRKILSYTQSKPPSYYLIPQSIGEIIHLFVTFSNNRGLNKDITIRYWFKGVAFDSLYEKQDVKYSVCQYLGILFLRLYFITNRFYQNSLALPNIPLKQLDKDLWIEKLKYLKSIINEQLLDSNLMKAFGYEKIANKTFNDKHIIYPIELIESFISQIEEDIIDKYANDELDADMLKSLDDNIVNSIKTVFDDISRISGDIVKPEKRDLVSDRMQVIRGTRILLSREAFLKNTHVYHFNSDKVLGQSIQHEYYLHFITKIYSQKKSKRLKVPNGKLFEAVEKLIPNPHEYIIICFGVNIDYLKKYQGLDIEKKNEKEGEMENYKFKDISVYTYNYNHPLTKDSLYLIKKEHKPMVVHKNWEDIKTLPQETEDKWRELGEPIDKNLSIYRKTKELNKDEELKQEYLDRGKTEDVLKNKIEVDVDFLGYIWFPKDTEIIEIKQADPFQEGGIIDQIEDIKPLPKEKKSN